MGLFGALTSAVSGLQAQAFAMQNISGNIANAQTIAYKGIDTNFSDLISGSGDASQQVAGGVTASSVATNSVQGEIQSSTTATNMAINGDGYFTVQTPTGFNGTAPIFSGSQNYTRRGDFALNADGYLVNGSGFYLEGIPIDPTTGDPVGNVATPLNFQSNFLPASATTQVDYAVNLPATPQTTATSALIPNSNLLNPANFTQNPTLVATAASNAVVTGTAALSTINASGGAITFDVNGQTVTLATNGGSGGNGLYAPGDLVNAINTQVGASANVNATLNGAGYLVITSTGAPGAGNSVTVNNFSSGDATQLGFASAAATANGTNGLPATGQVIGTDASAFVNETIDGGSITVYNATGTPANLQLRWAKTNSVAAGGTDTWELFYQVNPNATGGQVAWQNSGTQFVFNSSGQLTPPINSITLSNVNISGINLGNLTLETPSGAVTQFANSSGTSTVNNFQQNGFAAGSVANDCHR